jgi:hypothetical protein
VPQTLGGPRQSTPEMEGPPSIGQPSAINLPQNVTVPQTLGGPRQNAPEMEGPPSIGQPSAINLPQNQEHPVTEPQDFPRERSLVPNPIPQLSDVMPPASPSQPERSVAALESPGEPQPYIKGKANSVPYVMATLTPINIAMIPVTAAVALLLAAGGILVMTSSGRDWLFRRTAPASHRAANAQAGRIRILGGALAGMEVPASGQVILGRDPTKAQIVFPSEDTAVSRRHCEIRFDSAVALFEVRDLGSRNGTFIANGSDPPRRLTPDVVERLAPGQNILVGSSRDRLVLELG